LISSFEHDGISMKVNRTRNGCISLSYLTLMRDLFSLDLGAYFGGLYENFIHASKFELDFYNNHSFPNDVPYNVGLKIPILNGNKDFIQVTKNGFIMKLFEIEF
jgi:hypothetical protein